MQLEQEPEAKPPSQKQLEQEPEEKPPSLIQVEQEPKAKPPSQIQLEQEPEAKPSSQIQLEEEMKMASTENQPQKIVCSLIEMHTVEGTVVNILEKEKKFRCRFSKR
jgi:hypothetical protein